MAHPYGFWVVDQIDSPELLNAASRNIPGNASLPLQVVASLADTVHSLSVGDGIGEVLGLFTGLSGQELLRIQIGGAFAEMQPCMIPRGTRISLRRMNSAVAITSGELGINFIGGQV